MAGSVLPHPQRPADPDWFLLADFRTGEHALLDGHLDGLARAVAALRQGRWVWIRGLASRLGTDRGYDNEALSRRRAGSVYAYLTRQDGVPVDHITGVAAQGDRWSAGGPGDNSPEWRAVEVILTSGPTP